MWNVVSLFRQHRCHGNSAADVTPEELQSWEDKLFEARNYTVKEVRISKC